MCFAPDMPRARARTLLLRQGMEMGPDLQAAPLGVLRIAAGGVLGVVEDDEEEDGGEEEGGGKRLPQMDLDLASDAVGSRIGGVEGGRGKVG